MRILLACEESQAVCKEFRKFGHEAYSCDIQETSGSNPEWHIQGDVLAQLDKGWDMIIAFPPCTHLSAAGAPSWEVKRLDGRQQSAIDFVYKIRDAKCDLIAIENPTGKLNTSWREPDQIINPFNFGDPFKKRTCLWLKNLPKLQHFPQSDLFNEKTWVEAEYHYTSNSTRGGLLKNGTRNKSKLPIFKAWDSAKDRSKTFPGIAKAMADQWG